MASDPNSVEFSSGKPWRSFKVINGGGGTPPYTPVGDTGGGGGGGEQPGMNTRLDRLEQHRAWLWGVMSLAFAAIGGSFLFLLGQIDTRFDRADGKIDALSEQVTTVREGVAAQAPVLDAIKTDLENMDGGANQSERGNPTKPD